MTARNFISMVFIVLGAAIAGLGLTGMVWILTTGLFTHGFTVIVLCGVFIALGTRSILAGVRKLRHAPSSRP